jgi:hypothetical protein
MGAPLTVERAARATRAKATNLNMVMISRGREKTVGLERTKRRKEWSVKRKENLKERKVEVVGEEKDLLLPSLAALNTVLFLRI